MSRRRAPAEAAFGLAMLDVMSNALGALLIVFLINQIATTQQTVVSEAQAADLRRQMVSQLLLEEEPVFSLMEEVPASDHSAPEMRIDGLVGIAPAIGRLVLVLDDSGSMKGAKRDAVARVSADLIRRSSQADSICIIVFGNAIMENSCEETPTESSRSAVAERIPALLKAGSDATLLLEPLAEAIHLAALPPESGVVVLFSDGLADDQTKKDAASFVRLVGERAEALTRGGETRVDQVVVHTVSVTATGRSMPDAPLGSRFGVGGSQGGSIGLISLGANMEEIAKTWRGVHISLLVKE